MRSGTCRKRKSMASVAGGAEKTRDTAVTKRRCRLKKKVREALWLERRNRNREKILHERVKSLLAFPPTSPLDLLTWAGCDVSGRAGVSTGGSGRLSSLRPYLGCESSDDDDWRMIGSPRNLRRSSVSLLEQQPKLTARMRSVILCWLMEVCETYAIHRQTFYLAQDYFDRFLLLEKNLKPGALQLIVLTCLLIASKMEESKPLKIRHLSYVANGIYLVEEFRDMELVILKALRWYIRPETALTWLKSFLQVLTAEDNSDPLEQQFPKDVYIRITNLLDLCILDMNSLDMPYHGLAASVLCHYVDQELVEQITCVPKDLLQPCVDWMAPFIEALEEFGSETQKHFPTIKKEDQHNIQTKLDYMTILDNAYKAVNGTSPRKDVNPLDIVSYRQRIYVPGQGLTPPEDSF